MCPARMTAFQRPAGSTLSCSAADTQVQSRQATDASTTSTSLDGLRAGDVGDAIPREALQAQALFTNDFLP